MKRFSTGYMMKANFENRIRKTWSKKMSWIKSQKCHFGPKLLAAINQKSELERKTGVWSP